MNIEITDGRVQLPAARFDLDDALALWEQLQATLRDADWPRLTVVPPTDEDAQQLRCPRCGNESYTVIVADMTGERWNYLDVGETAPVVFGSYDGHADYHTFVYRCRVCEKPVSLPEGWTEL